MRGMNSVVVIVALIGFLLYGIGSIIEYRKEENMKRYICPYCGREMVDSETSTRFRCRYCKEFVAGWKEELHQQLEEAISSKNQK